VVHLEPLLQSAKNRNRVLHRRLFHQDRLKAAFERGVLFDVLAVFIQGGGTDAVELPPRQHGFEHVAGIHRSFGPARTYNGMEFVDEQNDPPFRFLDLLEDRFEALFELTAVLGTGHQRSHIEGVNGFAFETFRNVTRHNSLRQPFHHRRLADSRLTDEDRVVLGLPAQDAHNAPNFRIPANDRVQLVGLSLLDQVSPILLESLISPLRGGARHPLVPPHRRQGLEEEIAADAEFLDNPASRGRRCFVGESQEEVFRRNVLVFQPLCFFLSFDEEPAQSLR